MRPTLPRSVRARLRVLAALPLLLAAAPAPLMPGAWEELLTLRFDQVDGSADLAHRMQARVTPPAPYRHCVSMRDLQTPEQLFLAGAEQSCHFGRFAMADGHIALEGDCSDGHGQTMHLAGTGHYAPGDFAIDVSGTGQTAGHRLAFHGQDAGRRIGICDAL